MKNLMNKLTIVAIIAAFGFAGYVAVNYYMKNADNVKIQKKHKDDKDNHVGTNNQDNGKYCANGTDCKSTFCNDDYLCE